MIEQLTGFNSQVHESDEMKQSMYGARVEMRLANERAQVLKAFTEMAKDNGGDSSLSNINDNDSNKRPREE